MRTTIDLPVDLLEIAKSLARTRRQSLGQAVADLMRQAIDPPPPPRISTSPVTGLPVLTLGGSPITDADVAALGDDEDEHLASFVRPRPSQR